MVRAEVLGLALQRGLAVREDEATVGDRERQRDVLLDEDNAAAALLCELADDRQETLDDDRRQTEAQLVQQQELRMAGKRPPDREHLLLAAGEEAAAPVTKLRERREVSVRHVRVEALTAIAEAEVLGDGEAEEQAAVLRDVRDAELCAALGCTRCRSRPSKRITPSIGCTRPETARSVVVLPAPFAPSRATISPGATVRSMSRITAALS